MTSYVANKAEWRTWSTLIFWGVVALSVFGWFAGFMEMFSGITSAVQSVLGMMSEFGQMNDQLSYVQDFLDSFAQTLGIFEFLTFASWVVYLVGLYKFRAAQTTLSAVAGVKAINNACWTGLVAMAFAMFAAWAPWLVGLILGFIGWVVSLVSYFMFRSAFRTMESERGWNELARRGATLLRKSANFNIWLQVMPIIVVLVVLIVGLSTFSSLMNASNFNYGGDATSMGVNEYLGLYIFIGAILGLTILVLSVLQFVYRIWGWNRVMRGAPVEASPMRPRQASAVVAERFCTRCGKALPEGARFCQSCGAEVTLDEGSLPDPILDAPESEGSDVEEVPCEDEIEDNSKRNWLLGGAIGAIVVILLIFMIRSCVSTKEKIQAADQTSEIVSGEDSADHQTDEMSDDLGCETREDTAQDTDDDWDATITDVLEGSINNKYEIEMTVHRLDGMVWGSYNYKSNGGSIELAGQWGDDRLLTLTESVDGKETGQFIGTYSEFKYEGTWISPDGSKEFPFSVELKKRMTP